MAPVHMFAWPRVLLGHDGVGLILLAGRISRRKGLVGVLDGCSVLWGAWRGLHEMRIAGGKASEVCARRGLLALRGVLRVGVVLRGVVGLHDGGR